MVNVNVHLTDVMHIPRQVDSQTARTLMGHVQFAPVSLHPRTCLIRLGVHRDAVHIPDTAIPAAATTITTAPVTNALDDAVDNTHLRSADDVTAIRHWRCRLHGSCKMPGVVPVQPPAASHDTGRNVLRRVFDDEPVAFVVARKPTACTNRRPFQRAVGGSHLPILVNGKAVVHAGGNTCRRKPDEGNVVFHTGVDAALAHNVHDATTARTARDDVRVLRRADTRHHDVCPRLHIGSRVQPVTIVDNGVSRLVTDIDRTVAMLAVCRIRVAVRRGISRDVPHARIDDAPVHHVKQGVRPVRRGRYPLQRGVCPVPHQFVIQRDAHLEWRCRVMRLRWFRRGAVLRFLAVKRHRGLRGKQKAQPFQGLGYCNRGNVSFLSSGKQYPAPGYSTSTATQAFRFLCVCQYRTADYIPRQLPKLPTSLRREPANYAPQVAS